MHDAALERTADERLRDAPPSQGRAAGRASARASAPTPAGWPAGRRWAINGDFLTLEPTGVARYAREVTRALDDLVAEGHPSTEGLQLTILSPVEPDATFAPRAARVRVIPEATRPRLPQAWVQFQLPRHVEHGLLSFCNLAPVAVSRHVVCIHDLQTRIAPRSYGWLFRWAHRVVLPLLGHRAARIVTVSAGARADLVRFGIARAERIEVAHNGSEHARRWNPERAALALPRRPFVLCIARPQAHKNPDLIRRLAPLLDEAGLDLVVVGRLSSLGLDDAAPPRNVTAVGRVTDDDFAAALRAAHCFILPSRAEGFGLPAVEAMVWDCPVVASTAPSLPEVCGDAALYADPDDPAAWSAAIRALADDPGARAALVERGRARAAGFSWRNVALAYLAIMESIDRDERRR